jgi:uncharacterized protein (UPF0335 family)
MTDNVTAAELAQFVERIESIEGDIREYQETRKEVYAEAKSRGYSTPIMREIIRLRKLRPDDRAEREAVLDLYLSALGMA